MKTYSAFECGRCGSRDVRTAGDDYRKCKVCGAAQDRVYVRPDGKTLIHKGGARKTKKPNLCYMVVH